MSKGSRRGQRGTRRLGDVSLVPGLMIEGGLVPTGASVEEAGRQVQPQLALWLEPETGLIRGFQLLVPDESGHVGVGDALATLTAALTEPIQMPGAPEAMPGLPERLIVNDEALAEAARAQLGSRGVTVEYDAHPPVVEALGGQLAAMLGGQGEQPPFSWDIDPGLLPPLYEAAAALAAAAPWRLVHDNPPVTVRLADHGPEPGVESLYASIIGAGDMASGVALYYSLDDFEDIIDLGLELEPTEDEIDEALALLRQMGAPVDEVAAEDARAMVATMLEAEAAAEAGDPAAVGDSIACLYDAPDELDPSYLDWLRAHGLDRFLQAELVPSFLRTVVDEAPRPPSAGEVRALTLTLQALAQFAGDLPSLLPEREEEVRQVTYEATARLGTEQVPVTLVYPPDEYLEALDEGDEPDAEAPE